MKRKNGFFTFCFAMLPGAGQMYLGMMRKGIAIMTGFFGIIAVGGFLQIQFLLFMLPVLWCYAFFDTMNSRWLSDEERVVIDEQFRFRLDGTFSRDWKAVLEKRHLLVGMGLILVGVWALLKTLLNGLYRYIPEWAYRIIWQLPGILVYFAIIGLGFYLVRGKKSKSIARPEDEFIEYKGKGNDEHE